MRTSRPINNITAAPSIPQDTDDLTDEEMQWLAEEAWASECGHAEMAQVEFEKIDRNLLVAQHRGEIAL